METPSQDVLIAHTLRQARMFRGLTADQVSEGLGWPKWTVYYIERADRKTTFAEVMAYAEFLGLSHEDLMRFAKVSAEWAEWAATAGSGDKRCSPQSPSDLQKWYGTPLADSDYPVVVPEMAEAQ